MASKLSKSPSSPKPSHRINEKGSPILGVGSLKGYNKPSGTPGWVKSAASSAAKKAK